MHPKSLDPKLEAVLARLCERLGPLTKTRAVKLPYLVDVIATHIVGRRVAGGTYQTWEHGVVTREIFAFMTHTDGDERLLVEDHDFSESGRQVRLRGEAPTDGLSAEERAFVDLVADDYGDLDATRLGLLTKSLNTHLSPADWGSNQEAALGEEAYSRLSPGWQQFFEQIPELDLKDRSRFESVGDPRRHLAEQLGA
jgi:uncharacterized phage-associated protein